MRKSDRIMLFIFLAIFYCFVGAFAQSQSTRDGSAETFPVSAGTRMFIMDLEKELKASNKSISYFKPSARLVERHNIQNVKEEYFVSGFIQVNEKFKQEQIEKIGGYSGKPSGKVRTVRIPLSAFLCFLEQQGVTYFEISKKTFLQKSK